MKRLLALCAIALIPAYGSLIVYSQNFEGSGPFPEWTGSGSVQTTGGLSAYGFGANHWRNDTVGLTTIVLGGLAPHSTLTLTFDLAMWDSIDWGDIFQVRLDGVYLFNGEFGNYFAPGACIFGCMDGPGVALTPSPIDFINPQFGFDPGFRDSARHVTFTIPHTSALALITFHFPTSQSGLDESFGVDNILVETDAQVSTGEVPEPSTWALIVFGVAAGACWRRRSR